MKILALDLGDRWVGTALSDHLGITCKPFQTIELDTLTTFLSTIITQEKIATIVVGYPATCSGGQSSQTQKVVALKEALEKQFNVVDNRTIQWILWDERLSSKRAQEVQQKTFSAEAKKKSHSIAAAFILQCYLDNLAFTKTESY
jgi:putative holliday junction resolvase